MSARTLDRIRTIEEAARLIREGAVTSVELVAASLERIESLDPLLGAFVFVARESALAQAESLDRELSTGRHRGPLHGVPLAVKDFIGMRDAPFRVGCLAGPEAPAHVDSSAVRMLRDAGAVVVGKTTAHPYVTREDELDARTRNPRNPWDPSRSPGGSSSGAGVSVAAGMVLGGLGTDTTGSVRAPAAYNGHTGLSTTSGLVSKSGVVQLAPTLDNVGPMARSSLSCALLLDALVPLAEKAGSLSYEAALTGDLTGVRIGVPVEFFYTVSSLDPDVRAATILAIKVLEESGATISEVALPHAAEARSAACLIALAEASQHHRRRFAEKWPEYGSITRLLFAAGALLSAADLAAINRFRQAFQEHLHQTFAEVDAIVTPAMLAPATKPAAPDLASFVTSPDFYGQWSLAGLPALVVPSGLNGEGMPIATQIVSDRFSEATLLRIGDAYQRRTDWHLQLPGRHPAAA